MIILVEGADGVGKTELSKHLCRELGMDYRKFNVPDKKPVDYFFDQLDSVTGPTVLDRLHLSEDAYGNVFRGGSGLSDDDRKRLDSWLKERGGIVVYCWLPIEQILENQARSPDETHHGDPVMSERLVKAFRQVAASAQLRLPFYRFCYLADGDYSKITRIMGSRMKAVNVNWEGLCQ